MMTSQKAVLLLGVLACTVSGRDFLGARRFINSASVKSELDGVLNEVLGHGHGVMETRLSKIHKSLDPLFRSLPKNKLGRVSATVMRYAVRRYFSQNHGWIVKGFNVHEESGNSSAPNPEDILQSKLPGYIRSILEERFAHEGFSLDALVVMVASVERLVYDEVIRGVELAFYLNSLEQDQGLTEDDLHEVLSSFLITEMLEGTDDKEKHANDRRMIPRRYPFWDTTVLFLKDTIGSDIFMRQGSQNPFKREVYHSFDDAVRIAVRVSGEFGSWSNHECHEMKDMLTEMDVHVTGRVRLSDFYSYKDGAWQFLEPSEQLRQCGTLDESSPVLGPQVMIANYVTSMSNCITSQAYYSICCLNECDQVFQQLEAHIGAPTATAAQIVTAFESGTYETNITKMHRGRLDDIARVNDGKIPMYGRLFARWLHFVHPQECPYPHAPGIVKPMTQQQWQEQVGVEEESVSDDEIKQHKESEFARQSASPYAGIDMWSLDEAHLDSSTPSDLDSVTIWVLLRIAAYVGMLAGLLSLLKPFVQMLRSDAKVEFNV